MPRAFTSAGLLSLLADESAEVWLILLTLEGQGVDTLRLTSDAVATISRGQTFQPFPFQFVFPEQGGGQVPRARLVVDNLEPSLIAALRTISRPPEVTLELVRAAAADAPELTLSKMNMREINYDVRTISGELFARDLRTQAFPAHLFVPSLFPGLF